MLADIITGSLMLVLGYAYPAFECFKTVENNRVQIEELRFWCQYWILVAMMTVFERIGDVFVSWLPMYAEMKLALFLYLWYPKTKGSGYVYETLLRPFVSKHETDIDRSLQELRTRAWDLAIYYWQNCTELGQTKFFEVIGYLFSQSSRITKPSTEKKENDDNSMAKGSPPPPPNTIFSFHRLPNSQTEKSSNHVLPQPQPPKSETVQVHGVSQTTNSFVHPMDTFNPQATFSEPPPPPLPDHKLHGTSKFRFRRAKGSH